MCMHRTYINPHDMAPLENRVSQITNVFQKNILGNATLFYVMPF
jgi:hypothetical protein